MDAFPLQAELQKVEVLENGMSVPEDCMAVSSAVLTGHGRLQRIKMIDTPLPRRLDGDLVEVQVYYCGLNFTDNYLRLGIIRSEDFPIVMGSECCGVVRRVGPLVDDLQVGQRVVCLRMQGGLLRHVVQVPRRNCFLLPVTTSLTDAVAMALDFLVAYVCLFELGRLRKDGVVFMQSIAGGVGTAVAQLARQVPDTSVLGTASEQKHDWLRRLGVSRAYRHQDNYPERVLALHPRGADVVIVRGGGENTDKCLSLLKPCGRLIAIGSDNAATYPRTITRALQRPTWDTKYISSAELINKNVIVAGLNIGDFIENNPSDVQKILDNIFDMHFEKKIMPQVYCILPFEKVAGGLQLMCTRQNFGKVLMMLRHGSDRALYPNPERPLLGIEPREDHWTSWRPPMCKMRLKLYENRPETAARRLYHEAEDGKPSWKSPGLRWFREPDCR